MSSIIFTVKNLVIIKMTFSKLFDNRTILITERSFGSQHVTFKTGLTVQQLKNTRMGNSIKRFFVLKKKSKECAMFHLDMKL